MYSLTFAICHACDTMTPPPVSTTSEFAATSALRPIGRKAEDIVGQGEAAAAQREDRRMNVTEWLRGLELEQYATAFRDNEIGERVLPSLTVDDLEELGVNLIGHRRLLPDAIATLREAGPKQAASDLPAAPPQPAASSAGAARRQLMFCGLSGTTGLSSKLDSRT